MKQFIEVTTSIGKILININTIFSVAPHNEGNASIINIAANSYARVNELYMMYVVSEKHEDIKRLIKESL